MEIKRDFVSMEDTFSALSPQVREHSMRVAAYADVIFMEACSEEVYTDNLKTKVRLKPELRKLSQEAAQYHDVGKALVPDYYQWDAPGFSPEEQALFAKHCMDGGRMAEPLLAAEGANPTRIHTICEAIESHHEQWDGQGYPAKTVGEETPIIGRIVSLADAFDHLLMETRTETPVDTAISALNEGAGTRFDPVLVNLISESRRKLTKVFSQYEGQSRAIPQAPRIIRRKSNRPMCLVYRPIADVKTKETIALEANMLFKRGKDWVSYSEIGHIVKEKKLEEELAKSFLLETCDTLRRLDACGIRTECIFLNTVPGWLRKRGAAKVVTELLQNADMSPERVGFILTAEDWQIRNKTLLDNLSRLRAAGCRLLVDGVGIQDAETETLKALSLSDCRIPPADADYLETREAPAALRRITEAGIKLFADGVEKRRYLELLGRLAVGYATGTLAGEYRREDSLVSEELALLP